MNLWQKYRVNLRYAFRPHKPILLFRLAKTFANIFLFGARPLRYVDFALDYRCNMNCEHCFAMVLKKPEETRRMQLEDYRCVIRQCEELGAVNFSFQGGEPLIIKNLEEYIAAANPHRNIVSVTTNGVLVTPARARSLRKAGVDILTISLDSANPQEHDAFRRSRGAYQKTLAGIDAALDAGLNVTIGTVISHRNIRSEGIERLFEWVCEKSIILCVALAVPAGNWLGADDVLLTEEDWAYFRQLEKKYPYVRNDFEANFAKYGCGAVKEILYLTPYGDVLPCPFIHISLGNIFNESIKTIRERALRNPWFAEYKETCLCATDTEFIEKYMSQVLNKDALPKPAEEVFNFAN